MTDRPPLDLRDSAMDRLCAHCHEVILPDDWPITAVGDTGLVEYHRACFRQAAQTACHPAE